EFGGQGLELAAEGEPSARHVDGCEYELTGRVVHLESDAWVIDAGLLMFSDTRPPAGLAVGDLLRGSTQIGVDPFFYFERLAQRESMPPLIHTWDVVSIARQTAPFIEVAPRWLARDHDKTGWVELEHTDAWTDDDGRAEYILRCRLASEPPRKTTRTRIP
ncbi:MAG: hypothetical protein ABI175_01290, partial [Polyangiales bacterium]